MPAYAWLSLDTDDHQRALALASSAVKLAPNCCEAHAAMACSLGALGDSFRGIAEAKIAHQIDPRSSLGMIVAAIAGDPAATELCDTAVRIDPNWISAHITRDILSKNNIEILNADVKAARRISPDSATTASIGYLAAMASGRYQEALTDADLSVKIRPMCSGYLTSRAVAEFFCNKLDAANMDVERSLKLSPKDPVALNLKAQLDSARPQPQ